MQEIDRITKLSQSEQHTQDNTQQIENIWALFENRVSLLFGLAQETSDSEMIEDVTALFEEAEALNNTDDDIIEDSKTSTPMSFYKTK